MAFANTQIIPYSPPPSSSSSRSTQQFTYEVFLSFRGEDTRYGFTDHLYHALISHGIHTFRDDDALERGGVIASDLQKAIEESKIFVIILSPNYANSRWCLDELVEISQRQRLILPIFYHVDPSDVRKQTGSYEKAFVDHEKEADEEKKKKCQKWRIALMKVGNLAGYDLQKYRHETSLIQKIIDDIVEELNSKFLLPISKEIVGMNSRLEYLMSLIDLESNDVRMIGIYGLGGIGKTTISKVVYNNIFNLFESSIFLEKVRERSLNSSSQLQLLKELLNGAIKGKNVEIISVHGGISMIKQRLRSKRVLLILDDVDKLEQLKSLAGEHGWFGPKSRIIITTRDRHLLKKHKVDALYKVMELDPKESFQLFCQHAFNQSNCEKDFVSLSNDVVNYVNGLPLALEVLGSFLFNKSVHDWESTLHKLKKQPNIEIQNVLKMSYEGLDKGEQGTFLDIACFFNGCNENDVIRLRENARIDITVLHDKSLITLFGNTIRMHDLVQEMGREIVRHCKEPGEWSRLWDPEDISLVLRKKTGTKAIEGIFLDMSKLTDMEFTTKAFKRMKRLRLFKVYWSCGFTNFMGREYSKLLVPKDFEFPSCDLRYLHWEGYPLESLPSNFDGENLVELNLKKSSVKYLWQSESEKLREKLQVLNLSTSHQLTYMPCFSNMPNMEKLNIESCGSLEKVDQSIGCLNNLISLDLSMCQNIEEFPTTIEGLVALQNLNLEGCENLRSLPSNICRLKSLEYLNLRRCSKLKTFPEISENMECLKMLDFSLTSIEDIPESIEYLRNLNSLFLDSCTKLRSLSKNISRLKYLEVLNLSDCFSLESFPEIEEHMECLEELKLDGAGIKELPSSIKFLNHLFDIALQGCKNLRSLPSSICQLKSIRGLDLSDCLSLESFPEITEDMECLEDLDLNRTSINDFTYLTLDGCKNLSSLPSSLCRLGSLQYLSLNGCSKLESFPEIIEDMKCLKELDLRRTGIKELPSSIERLRSLPSLLLSDCENLRSLPSSICKLKSLSSLSLNGCSKLESFPEIIEDMKCLNELDLRRTGIKELSSSIERLRSLISLLLSHCENLRSLPSSICRLKYIPYLSLNGCSKLESFPEIIEDMKCLKELNLSRTSIKELPSSIERLRSLPSLVLSHCENLRSLPSSICMLRSLRYLSLNGCSKLESFPEIIEDMECLKHLDLSRTGIKELPSSIERLRSLISLLLSPCENLRSLPSSIYRLRSPQNLSLSGCSKLESFPENMESMDCRIELDLYKTGIKELPSSIENLSRLSSLVLSHCENLRSLPSSIAAICNLRILNISHCKMLEQIPELPSGLMTLDIRDCPSLGTLSNNPSTLLWSSLLEWLKKVKLREHVLYRYQWKTINLGSIGIPARWVQHQDMGIEIRIELPMNWYQDDHFLGFGFFCLHQSESFGNFVYLDLVFGERRSFSAHAILSYVECHGEHGSKLDEVLLLYYPKIAIPDKYHCNQYVLFKAKGKFNCYGIHLIYSEDHERNHSLSLEFPETQDDEDNHMPFVESSENSSENTSTSQHLKRIRDDAEHNNQAEEPHYKRYLRESNTDLKL